MIGKKKKPSKAVFYPYISYGKSTCPLCQIGIVEGLTAIGLSMDRKLVALFHKDCLISKVNSFEEGLPKIKRTEEFSTDDEIEEKDNEHEDLDDDWFEPDAKPIEP